MLSLWREKAAIFNFEQEESVSLPDTWERFRLILYKCRNHNMSDMEQMIHFIDGLKV